MRSEKLFALTKIYNRNFRNVFKSPSGITYYVIDLFSLGGGESLSWYPQFILDCYCHCTRVRSTLLIFVAQNCALFSTDVHVFSSQLIAYFHFSVLYACISYFVFYTCLKFKNIVHVFKI